MHKSEDSAVFFKKKNPNEMIIIKYLHENNGWQISPSKYLEVETQSDWRNFLFLIKIAAFNKHHIFSSSHW